METLTEEQAQCAWDCKTSCKKNVSDENVFNSFLFYGKVDGFRYHVNSTEEGLALDKDSTLGECEIAIVAHLQTVDYKGTNIEM